ncbi:MAG: hypothetical protein ACLP7Q_09395 [Isosphaeraceae bacterium]
MALGALLFGAAGPAHISRADEPAAADRNAGVPFIYQNKRSFRIPFHIDAQGRAHLKEVQLWVSEDSGARWEPRSRTAPDMGKFTFRTSHDGEFWFATRALTVDGKYSPPMNQTVEPSMKVVVDTVAPSIVLQSEGRRGSSATVRWDVKDECLDLKTLLLEYQVEGASDWRKVPIRRRSPRGTQTWDAGTADALRVRGSVADKAGNVADTEIVLPEGSGGEPDLTALDTDSIAPPVEQISSPGSSVSPGAELPPVQESASPNPGRGPSSRSPARRTLARRSRALDGETTGAFPAAPDWDRASTGSGGGAPGGTMRTINTPDQSSSIAGAAGFPNPFPASDGGGGPSWPAPGERSQASASLSGNPAGAGGNAGSSENRTMLVASSHFKLQYAIEDPGPNGPSSVELWITRDGGRTWIRRAEDPDRVTPLDVDLGGEGTFGISLVARSASGLGEQPPAPGDPPQSWVEVDTTPPSVQLYQPQIGTGPHAGKVAITWRASDLHLPPRSVSLFWRPDQPGAAWQPIVEGQENMGQYVWMVPPSFPARFHLRVEAIDSVGHRGGSETTDSSPVIVDRSRPRSRIIGLDPNARAGDGPAARPLR